MYGKLNYVHMRAEHICDMPHVCTAYYTCSDYYYTCGMTNYHTHTTAASKRMLHTHTHTHARSQVRLPLLSPLLEVNYCARQMR